MDPIGFILGLSLGTYFWDFMFGTYGTSMDAVWFFWDVRIFGFGLLWIIFVGTCMDLL